MPSIDSLTSEPHLLALLCVAAFFVGLGKGGMPAIAMLSVPLLSLYLSPLVAAVLLLPIYILSDLVSVWLYRREYSLENIRVLIPAGVLGVALGWALAAVIPDQMVSLLIGVMGVSFCLHMWLRKSAHKTPTQPSVTKGMFWGTLSGMTSFLSHAGAPPFQVYVLPQKLPKMIFAGTTTIVFAAVNWAKVIPYSNLHPYTASTLKVSAVLIPIAAVGTVVGKSMIERLPEKWFFLLVQIALFLISLELIGNNIAEVLTAFSAD